MDLTLLQARLAAFAPSLAQVLVATPGGYSVPVDSSTDLVATLSPIVGAGNVYPLTQHEDSNYPSIVYTLVSSKAGGMDGYAITQSDAYILRIRAETYDELITAYNGCVTALDGAAFETEVQDVLFDFDDKQHLYRANVQVGVTYLATGLDAQQMPAVWLYAISRDGNPTTYENKTVQLVETDYAIALASNQGNIPALADEIMSALMGWQQSIDHHPFEYVSGRNIDGNASLEVWLEVYRDSITISQSF